MTSLSSSGAKTKHVLFFHLYYRLTYRVTTFSTVVEYCRREYIFAACYAKLDIDVRRTSRMDFYEIYQTTNLRVAIHPHL